MSKPNEWKIEQGSETDPFVWIYREDETGNREYLAGTTGRIRAEVAAEILPKLNT